MNGQLSAGAAIGILILWVIAALVAARASARRGPIGPEAFTVAGRRVPYGIGSVSLLAAWTWSFTITTPAENGYRFGIAGPLYFAIGGALMLVVFAPVARAVRRLAPEGHTLPEFIASRHGEAGRLLILVINLLSAGVLVFLNLNVVGRLFEIFTPLSYEAGVVMVALSVGAYTCVSGVATSIITDVIQFAVITVAALVLLPAVIVKSGGVALVTEAAADWGEKASLLSPTAFWKLGLPFLLMSWFTAFAYPSLWQYAWALRERDVARTFRTAGVGWSFYGVAFGVLGVIGLAMGLQLDDPSGVAFEVASRTLSPALSALFVALVLTAAASSCDGSMAAFGALFMTDVYRAHIRRDADDRAMLRAGRLAVLAFAAAMALIALRRVSFMQAVFFLGAAKGAMLFPLLATVWWKRLTRAGFTWGVAIGMVSGATLFLVLRARGVELYELISIPASVVIGALVAIVVSLTSRATDVPSARL